MPGLRETAVRWYRKTFGAPAGANIRDEGLVTVLDGNSAVALSEAGIVSHTVLGGSLPASSADEIWLAERGNTNLYGEALSAQSAEGPRGVVAALTGLALAGCRATAIVSGPDIAASQDLLVSAAGKHAPLVLHLATRAITAHGSTPGSAHDCVHLSADSGCFLLFAANVQQAVDFTYIARYVAEEALVPGIVVMDGEQTALAIQDVRLLSPAQVSSVLGPARQLVEAPTEAQKLLFGEMRRRVPAWHDLDEPVLTGALFEPENFALGALARGPYFDAFVEQSLAAACTQFARSTGRSYEALSKHEMDDAKVVILAQGAAIETARVAAAELRKRHKIRAGVLGVHALRPFPGAALATALDGCEKVFVLERLDATLSGEPPLTRDTRANLARHGNSNLPECVTAIYGVGGLPLRVTDIVELCTHDASQSLLYLGLAFDDPSDEQPKREVLLDALRRAYPDVARTGVRAATEASQAHQADTLTIAIQHSPDSESIAGATAALLHQVNGGRIRSRPALTWRQWSGSCVDWITLGDESLEDPGDGVSADVMVESSSGDILVASSSQRYRVPLDEDAAETLLGGLLGVLINNGLLDAKVRRLVALRQNMLEDADETRREQMISAFRAGLEQVSPVDEETVVVDTAWEGEVPATVRHLGRDDDHYASLPRFWDQLGVPYREGKSERLTAGPYLATGTMPPLSSTFSDFSQSRRTLPVFEPSLCTGCGNCWTHCPDSAIGAAAASPAALIEAGINSTGADAVRQVSSKLASRIIASNKVPDEAPATFGEMLGEAFSWLEEKMPLPAERKQAICDGVEEIRNEFGALPVAVTKPFFHDAEAARKDGAELLSLAINPDACKACGVCVSSCEPAALSLVAQDKDVLSHARDTWSRWACTPDTNSETLDRVTDEIGSMASLLLSRFCQFALAGGDTAEPGSGEKMAVRLLLAATEYHQQPLVQRFATELEDAGEALSKLTREMLSGTVDDLDAVSEKLRRTTSPRVDLQTLAEGGESVDTEHLLRLIELSRRIESAHHGLVEGEHGLGRARYGIAIAGGSTANWAGAFPHNPFQAPVLIDMSGDAAQLAAGLIGGHLDETTELARLLRQAHIEIEQPDGADWKREELVSLRWQDLSDAEFELCPPLILIGNDEMLAGRGLGQLIGLLNSGLPIKVLVLHSLDFGLCGGSAARANLGLLALAQRDAFVAQTSVANSVHLGDCLLGALAFDGPAIVQVYAPSPMRHGFASEQSLQQAALATNTRAMPLYRYDPGAAGVFGSRISLDGNPLPHESLVQHEVVQLTPADWALGQQRFTSHFEPLSDDAPTPVAMHEWLQLDARGRLRKTPFVSSCDTRYSVARPVTDMALQCLETWQTLQELAGIVTPFTERLEKDIRAEVAAEHQAQLDAQQKEAEDRIGAIQRKTEAEIASKIRSRLLQLSSRKRG